MEYTKGEWTYFGDGIIVAPDGKQIASILPMDRKGNAHLIVAAPDMYEALGEMATCLELMRQTTGGDYPILDRMNKALAKAEGKGE